MKKAILIMCAVGALTACGEKTKQNLGLVNTPPDEFAVVTRAPLSVPPDYTLRPPRPGAGRPMEMSTQEQARQTIFGENNTMQTGVAPSDTFLSKVGVQNADPNIRTVIDSEKGADNRTTAERLLFMSGGKDEGEPLDPNAEYERLKQEGVYATKKRSDPAID